MNTLTLTCPKNVRRLDKFLTQAIPTLSRAQAKRLIEAGLVQADNLALKPSLALNEGTVLTVSLPEVENPGLQAKNIPLNILYNDEHVLAINKPAGLVVHPGAGQAQNTLVNGLIYHYPALKELDEIRPGIVHRLDKETSGVILVARTETALNNLQTQFKTRQVDKRYLALVHGTPKALEGIIDVPLKRDSVQRQRMTVHPEGKPARTHYRVQESFSQYSLLDIKLETGRTHQIRVHLSWLGHPVVGDSRYGRRKTHLPLKRQFLHAYQISFTHPHSNTPLKLEAPLPEDLSQLLEDL